MFNNILANLWELILFLTQTIKHIRQLTPLGMVPLYYYLSDVGLPLSRPTFSFIVLNMIYVYLSQLV